MRRVTVWAFFGLTLSLASFTHAAADAIEVIDNPQVFTLWLNPADYPRIDRAVNLMSAQTTRLHALTFVVDHRTFQPVQTNTFHDWAGFDAGLLRVGLALRYGILDTLDLGILRLSNGPDLFDTYQFDAKYWALAAERAFVDIALRAGGTWYSASRGPDSGGGFFQVLASRNWRERAWLGTGLLYHSNVTNDLRPGLGQERAGGQAFALAIPVALEVRLQPYFAWDAEASFSVAGNHAKYPVLTSAFKIITYRHTFSLLVSNSQVISADGVVANTSRGARHLVVGFTITREFNL